MHRSSIAVTGESAASYALINLNPEGEGTSELLPLNVALIVDVSGSMYEDDGVGVIRLGRIQEAVLAGFAKLKPEDTLAVVAFGHDAQVVLPPTRLVDLAAIEDAIRRIDSFGVDPGGASMADGISLGLDELNKNCGPGRINEAILLIDGEISDEEKCHSLAEQARDQNIQLTLIGMGTDWQANVIKELARRCGGRWRYIDATQAEEAKRVLLKEFDRLSATALANVEIQLKPIKDVRVKRLRQVAPEIQDLPLAETEVRGLKAQLGRLERDQPTGYILEMSLPRRADGKYVVAQMEIASEGAGCSREIIASLPLEMQYTSAGSGYVNAEIAKHIDEVQIFELNNSLQKALAENNQGEAQRLAENIAKKGDLLGPRGALKTLLAKKILDELHHMGRITPQTQLAMDDMARWSEEEKDMRSVGKEPGTEN
jgi:secreted protein with Ig-like and vWFA domain